MDALHLIRKMTIKERSGILTRLHVNKIQEPHKQRIILDFQKKRISFTEATTRINAFIAENIEYFNGFNISPIRDKDSKVMNLRNDKDKDLRQYTNNYITYEEAIKNLNCMEHKNKKKYYSRNPCFLALQYKCETLRDKCYETNMVMDVIMQ